MTDATDRKLFLGSRLRRLRRDLGVSQTQLAEELGLSPSYVNHLERNQRPVTAQVLLKLTQAYDLDLREFVSESGASGAKELGEVFADSMFKDLSIPRHEIVELAENAPAIADAVVRLYQAHERRRAIAPEALAEAGEALDAATPTNWVRDYIQSRHNYFAEFDEEGERLAGDIGAAAHEFAAAAQARLEARHRLEVKIVPRDVIPNAVRWYDMHRRRLWLSEVLTQPGRSFALAFQLAIMEHGAEIDAHVERASPPNKPIARLLKVSLANYLAAAVVMPYERFQAAAEELAYDIDILALRFGVSFEQAAHRLTTLSRPGARGVPFFMLRVDPAGNVSKRFSAGPFPFSRFGGACPRWNIHSAFRTPGRIVSQVIESTDGERYFTVSRTVPRVATAYLGEDAELAIGLGCELKHANRLVYSKGIDLAQPNATPVGPACRLCERAGCPQRAAEPIHGALEVDEYTKTISAYHFTVT